MLEEKRKPGRPRKNRRPVHLMESLKQAKAFEAIVVCADYDGSYSDLVERLVINYARSILQKNPAAMEKYKMLLDN